MHKIINALEEFKYPRLAAKALKMTESDLMKESSINNLDLSKYINDLKSKVSKIDITKDFDVILAYTNKKFPQVINEEFSNKLFDLISNESQSILDFLIKIKEEKATYNEYVHYSDKIEIYGRILDLYCKGPLRKKTNSIKWDSEISSFCKRLEPKILELNQKGYAMDFYDSLDAYVLKKDDEEFTLPVKPFFFILKNILNIKSADSKELVTYYMALKHNKKSEKITQIWMVYQILKQALKIDLVKSLKP